MIQNELFKSSLNKAMALCAGREYCVSDMAEKLKSWGLGDSDIATITGILEKESFINEKRFASSFVKDKFNQNRWGRMKIAAHLKAKKIPSSIIDEALNSLDREEYESVIRNLLASHRRSVKARNRYELKAKLIRFGLSRGFESSLLYDILNDIQD
jgi:regulatory protein